MSKHSKGDISFKRTIAILLILILISIAILIIKIKLTEYRENETQMEISQVLNTIDIPQETITPENTKRQLQIEELQKEMEAIKTEQRIAELDSLITSEATKAKIPTKLLDVVKPSLLSVNDKDECLSKLADFKVIWGDVAKELVESDYKTNGTNPKKSPKGKINDFDNAINNGDSKKALRALLSDM